MSRPRYISVWLVLLLTWHSAVLAWGQSTEAGSSGGSDPAACAVTHHGKKRTGITNQVLSWLGESVDRVIRPGLLNRGTAYGALLLIIVLHVVRCTKGVDFPGFHTFLTHLFVLNTFYSVRSFSVYLSSATKYQECPFMLSAAFLVIDAVVRGVVHKHVRTKPTSRQREKRELKVVNRYMQVAAPFSKALLFFICQFSLMTIFVYELDRDKETKDACNVSFFKWFVASILTVICGQSEVGQEYDPRFWELLLVSPEAKEHGYLFACIRMENWYIFKVRHAFGFTVNNIFRMLILGLCPIMLCVSTHFEFIKDCLALFFITKLDDVDGGSSLEEELKQLQAASEVSKQFDLIDTEAATQNEQAPSMTPLMDTQPEEAKES